jgi:hypothetical protein
MPNDLRPVKAIGRVRLWKTQPALIRTGFPQAAGPNQPLPKVSFYGKRKTQTQGSS